MTTTLAPAAEIPIPPEWADLWRFLDAWHAEHPQPEQRPEEER